MQQPTLPPISHLLHPPSPPANPQQKGNIEQTTTSTGLNVNLTPASPVSPRPSVSFPFHQQKDKYLSPGLPLIDCHKTSGYVSTRQHPPSPLSPSPPSPLPVPNTTITTTNSNKNDHDDNAASLPPLQGMDPPRPLRTHQQPPSEVAPWAINQQQQELGSRPPSYENNSNYHNNQDSHHPQHNAQQQHYCSNTSPRPQSQQLYSLTSTLSQQQLQQHPDHHSNHYPHHHHHHHHQQQQQQQYQQSSVSVASSGTISQPIPTHQHYNHCNHNDLSTTSTTVTSPDHIPSPTSSSSSLYNKIHVSPSMTATMNSNVIVSLPQSPLEPELSHSRTVSSSSTTSTASTKTVPTLAVSKNNEKPLPTPSTQILFTASGEPILKRRRGRPPNMREPAWQGGFTFLQPTVWTVNAPTDSNDGNANSNNNTDTTQTSSNNILTSNAANDIMDGSMAAFTSSDMDTVLQMPKKKRGRKPKTHIAGNSCFVWKELTATRSTKSTAKAKATAALNRKAAQAAQAAMTTNTDAASPSPSFSSITKSPSPAALSDKDVIMTSASDDNNKNVSPISPALSPKEQNIIPDPEPMETS